MNINNARVRRPGVVISNEQFFIRTKFAVVCPITNTSNKFPLHILLLNDKSQEAAKKEKSPKHTANLSADMDALWAFSVVNVRAELSG